MQIPYNPALIFYLPRFGWLCFFSSFGFRVLHESLQSTDVVPGNGDMNQLPNSAPSQYNIDADLAMALRISEQEQNLIQEELKREQEMLEEVLRLSLQEK